jgi:hypothetical protein
MKGDLKERPVDVQLAIIANHQIEEVSQLCIGSLDFPTFAVAAQGASVLGCLANPANSVRHDQLETSLLQLCPQRVPIDMQLERQLRKNSSMAITYTNASGPRMLRSEDINAPHNGVYPLGPTGPVFEVQSNGRYNQNQLSNAARKPAFCD